MGDLALFILGALMVVAGVVQHSAPAAPAPTPKPKGRHRGASVSRMARRALEQRSARRNAVPEAFESMPGIEDWINNGR